MSQNIKRKILVAAIHYPIASGRYIARALHRRGHDVRTIGPETGKDIWGITLPDGCEWKPDYPIFPSYSIAHGWTFIDVKKWHPELIITADSAYAFDRLASNIIDVYHVCYGVDNHVRTYEHGAFDRLFLAHSNGYRIGEHNVEWLPCAYDPEWHYISKPWNARPFHAAMIGVMYEERAEIVNKMGKAGLRVLAGTGPIINAYRKYYNEALISICKSVKGDMAQRVFETAAMGNMILSDRVPDMEKLGMIDGVHYVGYDTPDEAVQKALEIVHDWEPEQVKAMIDASLDWVKPHTWDARCAVILEAMGL